MVAVMEGIFQRKGGVPKVQAMEHQVTRTLQLQALRERLKARMSKKRLKLALALKRNLRRTPRTKLLDLLMRR
jgi:hypothetical protein